MTTPRAVAQAIGIEPDLADRVRRSLQAHSSGFAHVCVTATAAEVRLRGPVRTFYLRQRAIAVARQAAGARQVVDNLEVPLPGARP